MKHGLPLVAMAALLVGCGGGDPPPPADGDDQAVAPDDAPLPPSYERNFVFASVQADTILLVPWLLVTTVNDDGVTREARGWLARGGIWDPFFEDAWVTPPTRSPERPLPTGDLGFVVGEGGAIDGVLFDRGARRLELALGEAQSHWVGPRGEDFEVIESAAYLSEQRIEGTVLDMSRAWGGEAVPGGDWAFLLSGDSARFVFTAEFEHGGEAEPMYRGWADAGSGGLQWPEVHVDWRETQGFPPARRDVPVAWRLWSEDGFIEGELEALSAEIQPGEGPGPLLPVRALFEVSGDISTVSGNFEVRGLLVHERR